MKTRSILAACRGLLIRLPMALGAVLVILGLLAITASAAEASGPEGETVVSLTFDDGDDGQYQVRPLLDEFGMNATFYINSDMIGTWPRMTWEEVEDLGSDGNEIGGHTLNHVNLAAVSAGEAARQVCDDRVALQERGFDPVSFAYPFGAFDAGAEQTVAECGYASARSYAEGAPPMAGIETLPPADPFATRTVVAVGPQTSLADLQGYVEEAESGGGGWVQYVFHHVCKWGWGCDASAEGPLTVSLDTFVGFLDWLDDRAPNGTTVKTVREALGLGALQAPSAPTGVDATVAGAKSVSVSWLPPPEGGPAAKYEITPFAGSEAQAPTIVSGIPLATSRVVTGLQTGTTYTFEVRALNVIGPGPQSAPSSGVTPSGPVAPFAPTGVIARPASHSAMVEWNPPFSEEGSPITGYTVTPYIDGEAQDNVVEVDGSQASAVVPRLPNSIGYTFKVRAASAVGLSPRSAPSARVKPQATLFDFQTPATLDVNDSDAVELGMKFSSDIAGNVRGVRFFKAAANTGTHLGSLWTAGGELLARATFTNETATGWQTALFDEPVEVDADTTYVVSYFAPHGHFSWTQSGFAGTDIKNHPLRGIANGTSANGVYAYGETSSFPNEPAFTASNYYVDLLFDRSPTEGPTPPEVPTGVIARPASHSALVEWNEPFSEAGSPITGYTITPYIDGEAQEPIEVGGSQTSNVVGGLENSIGYTFRVRAVNAVGPGPPSSPSARVKPQATLFDFQTPSTLDVNDPNAVELGMKFSSDITGNVRGVRFFKAAANTGTHLGSLWTAGGELLAQATFANETATGWQTALFDEPVDIDAGTTYVVSYYAPHGHFSWTQSGFAGTGISHPPLRGVANGVSANGVYAYGETSSFPTEPAFNASNYYVDLLFDSPLPPGPTPPAAPTGVIARPASSSALVEWNQPFSEGESPITGHTVTPYIGGEAQEPIEVNGAGSSLLIENLQNGTAYTFRVAAINDAGTSAPSAPTSAVTPRSTIFDFDAPETLDVGESIPVELGVKFRSEVPGQVTGIRFFKAAANTGTHVGSLWTAGGGLLAQATFSNETATGWQTALFEEPVEVDADTTYVASYFSPSGHFSATIAAFSSGGITNPPLQALDSNTSGGNGVYTYGSSGSFPNEPAFNARNYFVDVLFASGVPTPPPAPTLANAAGVSPPSGSRQPGKVAAG